MEAIRKATSRLRRNSPEAQEKSKPGTNGAASKRQPIKKVTYPHLIERDQRLLHDQGWTPLTFPDGNEVRASFDDLFQASNTFFNLPAEAKEKYSNEKLGSEEGWSKIPGEKEMITLRTLASTPPELREAAERCWNLANTYLNEMLGLVAESLDLPPEKLQQFSTPQLRLPESERHAAMLRLFRYEVHEDKVVAEPHNDLGLLSMVISDTPGLEVWDRGPNRWVDIERITGKPVLLCGRQIQRLSNDVYPPGGHLVRSYGPDAWCEKPNPQAIKGVSSPKYRHSIVIILRAHWPIIINTDELTTKVTGQFTEPVRGVTTKDFFMRIKGQHYNINTGVAAREQQKRDIEDRKRREMGGQASSGAPAGNEGDTEVQQLDPAAQKASEPAVSASG